MHAVNARAAAGKDLTQKGEHYLLFF